MWRLVVCGGLLIIACPAYVQAGEKKPKLEKKSGILIKVDVEAKTITVRIKGEEETFKVAADVKVMSGKKGSEKKLTFQEAGATQNVPIIIHLRGDVVQEIIITGKKKSKE